MGYADIRTKRTTTVTQRQPLNPKQKEISRFKIGTVYKVDGEKFVCVDRYTDKTGTHVGMVSLPELRAEKKDEFGDIDYQGQRELDCATYDAYFVRTDDGVEFAVDECDICLIDGEKNQYGGRFDIDGNDGLERVRDVARSRADKTYGVESLDPETKDKNLKKPRKSKKGNPIAGLILIAVIILLIRACTSS